MITGIVAQERLPLPHGVLAVRDFDDDDAIFESVVTSGLDQRLFHVFVAGDDQLFPPELPQVLTVGFHDDTVVPAYSPLVARDHRLLAPPYISPDNIHLPDIRIPGYLQPPFHTADDDRIFPTPLILDSGMLRAEDAVFDFEAVYPTIIDAAQTLYPASPVDAPDVIHPVLIRSSVISPRLVLSDDVIPPFLSKTGYFPSLVIDDGLPVVTPTQFDGPPVGVSLSVDKLTATHINTNNYCGVRSTLLKTSGKFYFEVTVGPTHGIVDGVGLIHEDAGYDSFGFFSNQTVGAYSQYNSSPDDVTGETGGPIAYNFTKYGNIGRWVEGDIISVAVDLDNRQCWFRRNGGNWNGHANGDPLGVARGAVVPRGPVAPMLGFGGEGRAGDSMTANFGKLPYRYAPPTGYLNWIIPSPFGPMSNGDSVGPAILGLPARLDGLAEGVSLTNGFLTATHPTTNTDCGVRSASLQIFGRYYFEVRLTTTHGENDCVGIVMEQSNFNAVVSNGNGCAIVWATGAIKGTLLPFATATIDGPIVSGDVIGVAVDLSAQSSVEGGFIWFRKNGGFWNNDPLADPVTISGGAPLVGFNWRTRWYPFVGFGGRNTAIGDQMDANFGSTPFASRPPAGFAVWSMLYNDTLQGFLPLTVTSDDGFPAPVADLALKLLYHPDSYHTDNDFIHPTRSTGGNLLLIPQTVVIDPEPIHAPGYFPSLDGVVSPQVTLSADKLTATVNTAVVSIGARSTSYQFSGKYYFEVTYTQTTNDFQQAAGILMEDGRYTDMPGGGKCTAVIDSTIYSNGGHAGKSIPAIVSGDVIGIAINLDNRRAWFRHGNGNWNGTIGADPVTNNGGVQIASLAAFAPACAFGFFIYVGDSLTFNFGKVGFAYQQPFDFLKWPGGSTSKGILPGAALASDDVIHFPRVSPINLFAGLVPDNVENVFLLTGTGGTPTLGVRTLVDDLTDVERVHPAGIGAMLASLDGVNAGVVMSNSNLTATHSSTLNNSGAITNTASARSGGKFYWEVTMTNVHGDSDCVGHLGPGGTLTNLVTQGQNCSAVYRWNGNIHSNNNNTGNTLGPCTSGDVISVALDLNFSPGRLVWFRKNGGNWNGLPLTSSNPATGIGGVTINGSLSSHTPAVGFGGANTQAGDSMTANFGTAPFAYQPPTGFNKWTV